MKSKNKTTNLQLVVCLHLPSDTIETFVFRGLRHAAGYLRGCLPAEIGYAVMSSLQETTSGDSDTY